MTNPQRIRIAHVMLKSNPGNNGEPLDDQVIDALANLMHLCHVRGIDFSNQLRIADNHFHAEIAPVPA